MGGRIGGYGYRAGRDLLIEFDHSHTHTLSLARLLCLVGWALLGKYDFF